MKSKDTNQLIEELVKKVDYWVNNRKLFCGGCCFAAGVLAKGFERLGIKYTTMCFQDSEGYNCKSFNKLCAGEGCAHIAISVVYKHKKILIGNVYDVVNTLNSNKETLGQPWRIREYRHISSDALSENYWSNDWNWTWDTLYNDVFAEEINEIFTKYLGI